MNKVVLEQHLKEGHSANPCYGRVELMGVLLEVGDGLAIDIGLNQHFLHSDFVLDLREMHIMVPVEQLIELTQVALFYAEVQLVRQSLD